MCMFSRATIGGIHLLLPKIETRIWFFCLSNGKSSGMFQHRFATDKTTFFHWQLSHQPILICHDYAGDDFHDKDGKNEARDDSSTQRDDTSDPSKLTISFHLHPSLKVFMWDCTSCTVVDDTTRCIGWGVQQALLNTLEGTDQEELSDVSCANLREITNDAKTFTIGSRALAVLVVAPNQIVAICCVTSLIYYSSAEERAGFFDDYKADPFPLLALSEGPKSQFLCKLQSLDGENRKLVIARFLLEHGNTLEEMVFSWSNQVEYNKKSMKITNEVSKLYKASSNVKLTTLLKD
ncbi:hypothetical protein Tco_0246876 [Tanacetum coccineum]